MSEMTLDEAISFLKQGVKYSAIPGQKHIDPGLFPAQDQKKFEAAMKVLRNAIKAQEITEVHAKDRLGLT